ncbi:hypothetical protein [Levilactobacillus brevis]|uniref:hypothetical protein n=1 Tax=Levilactobacillus brevis TaxID=1580 RepID=UPI0021A57C13|nr:hypothetical protein [Levilactobacillus brevis]
MATPNVGILTTAGKSLIDKVNSGQTKISFSKIVFSSMDNSQLSDMQVKALTAIAPQEVVVSSPETTLDTNSGETRIRATGTNEKLADGVYVKTYGVFAKDDTGSEILYGVTVSPNPNYFPAYDGVTPQAVTYSYKTVIQETSNITMTNSNDVYASQEDLAEALQPYAKTVDVNQQLDKKVNIADMRKPASDVAGIEEVSTLQTQVDNSAVGTNLLTGTGSHTVTGTGSNANGHLSNETDDDILTLFKGLEGQTVTVSVDYEYSGFVAGSGQNRIGWQVQIFTDANTYPGPWYYPNNNSGSGRISSTFVVPKNITGIGYTNGFIQFSGSGTGTVSHLKLEKGSVATDWCPNPEDKVNVSDMRKPASDVAGIEEVNAKQDKIGYTPADDSKVAHLSGANNFDTVPTVKNNPLLLASSLPSDLARTGSNQEFTGKNTFDTAPIDKATGNPYITKDGVPAVPSTLADTTKDANFTGKLQKSGIDVATKSDVTTAVSTATANMVDSTKATNFTAGLQAGGVDVATAADLKSVEDKAWRRLDFGPDDNLGGALVSSYIIYQIHDDEKYLSFFYLGVGQSENKTFPDNTALMDLSSIVKGISSIDFSTSFAEISDSVSGASSFQISGTKIITSTSSHKIYVSPKTTVSLYPLNHNDRRIYYTELV